MIGEYKIEQALSFDAPSLANPREYLHKSYLARN